MPSPAEDEDEEPFDREARINGLASCHQCLGQTSYMERSVMQLQNKDNSNPFTFLEKILLLVEVSKITILITSDHF